MNITKFLCNVQKSLLFNILKSELRSGNPFWNASAMNKDGVSQMRKFGKKQLP